MDARDIPHGDWTTARDRSLATARAWRRSADWLALADIFDDIAESSVNVTRDRAIALLNDDRWARRMIDALTPALVADPLFEAPLRISRERGRIGAVLFESSAARVTASIVSVDAIAGQSGTRVVTSGHLTVVRYVRAGNAHIRRWRTDGDRIDEVAPLAPIDGDVAVHDGRDGGHVIVRADSDIVMLSVLVRAGAGPVMREFDIADGALLRTASTDDGASRAAMLLMLLRVSGRTDAGAAFDVATRDSAAHARWGAMREWLALDAMAALPRLTAMARDDSDAEVRETARATLTLVERRRAECHA